MIQKFVDRFMAAKPALDAELAAKHPEGYDALVQRVVEVLAEGDDYGETLDPKRITVIDHGDYQGTRLYVIGAKGYQPSRYWSIFVDYGSCSGCDSFEATREYGDDPPTEKQARDYWTMMLHMVQSMKVIGGADEPKEA